MSGAPRHRRDVVPVTVISTQYRALELSFEKFVGDLGEYYDRLKKTLPADDSGAGATPFVRGKGGTASKRTDPMDDD